MVIEPERASSAHLSGPIRPVRRDDTDALKAVIDARGLFPAEMLDDMIAGYLSGDVGDECWHTIDAGGPLAVACYVPERMAQGTWNLLLIAAHPHHQGQGRGAALVRHIEQALAAWGERLLPVEISGLSGFEGTRTVYRQCGYEQEARIRDFYQAGGG